MLVFPIFRHPRMSAKIAPAVRPRRASGPNSRTVPAPRKTDLGRWLKPAQISSPSLGYRVPPAPRRDNLAGLRSRPLNPDCPFVARNGSPVRSLIHVRISGKTIIDTSHITVDTPMVRASLAEADAGGDVEKMIEVRNARCPMKRMGDAGTWPVPPCSSPPTRPVSSPARNRWWTAA